MSGGGDKEYKPVDQSDACIWWESLEHEGMLISPGGHFVEFTVPVQKQYDKWLWRYWSDRLTNQETAFGRLLLECDGTVIILGEL